MKAIVLKPIDADNISDAFDLELSEEQRIYVSHPMRSLALGFVHYAHCRPFGIYDGEKMVGYVMLRHDPREKICIIWHFMIDESMQGRGYGKAALNAALGHIRSGFDGVIRVLLTCHPDNSAALSLYRRAGFADTGRTEGVEIELALNLI